MLKALLAVNFSFVILSLAGASDWHSAQVSNLEEQSELDLEYQRIPSSAVQHGSDKWSHGGLVHIGMDFADPSVYTFDHEGRLIAGYDFKIPDAIRIQIHGFDRGADASVALCGLANDSEGRASYFIARISPDGKTTRITRTNPYWPSLISIASDGSVWTAGAEVLIFPDGSQAGINPNGHVLRHYDQLGNLIASTGPASAFDSLRNSSGFLIAAQDRLAWYSPGDGKGVYVEYSLDLRSAIEYPGAPGDADGTGRVTGLAYTGSGTVFLTLDTRHPRNRTVFRLDRARRHWVRLEMPHPGFPWGPSLWGSDRDLLVFPGRSSGQNWVTAKLYKPES